MTPRPPIPTLFPYTTLFRSSCIGSLRSHNIDWRVQTDEDIRAGLVPHVWSRESACLSAAEFRFRNELPDSALPPPKRRACHRSEEHTSELQSHVNLVCRLLL